MRFLSKQVMLVLVIQVGVALVLTITETHELIITGTTAFVAYLQRQANLIRCCYSRGDVWDYQDRLETLTSIFVMSLCEIVILASFIWFLATLEEQPFRYKLFACLLLILLLAIRKFSWELLTDIRQVENRLESHKAPILS